MTAPTVHPVQMLLLAIVASMRRLLALTAKEIRMIFKDPRSRVTVIIPPIVQLIVFGYAATFEVSNVPLVVVDQSRSEESRSLIAAFESSDAFVRIATTTDLGEMRELITSQKARAALHIGPTFARDLAAGEPANVQFIVDARSSNTAAITTGYAARIVTSFNERTSDHRPANVSTARPRQVRLIDLAWFNENYLSRWFFVPAIVVQLVLIEVLLICTLSVAREREQGTFDQLLVAPYATWELLAGKAAPGLLIGLPQAAVAGLIAVYWFEVPLRGSLAALTVGLLSYITCAAGVGLFISSLARTMQQALLGTFLFMMPASLLSGLATPIEDMPRWIQLITYLNPARYALSIGRDVFLRGAALADIVDDLLPMTIIGVVCLALAGVMFRLRSQ